jgi:hypothetical protein
MENLVKITTYNTRAEAELMADLLKKSGIKSMVSSEGTGLSHFRLFNGPSQLLVNEEDEQKAREILEI